MFDDGKYSLVWVEISLEEGFGRGKGRVHGRDTTSRMASFMLPRIGIFTGAGSCGTVCSLDGE